jgi:hypothetical protein
MVGHRNSSEIRPKSVCLAHCKANPACIRRRSHDIASSMHVPLDECNSRLPGRQHAMCAPRNAGFARRTGKLFNRGRAASRATGCPSRRHGDYTSCAALSPCNPQQPRPPRLCARGRRGAYAAIAGKPFGVTSRSAHPLLCRFSKDRVRTGAVGSSCRREPLFVIGHYERHAQRLHPQTPHASSPRCGALFVIRTAKYTKLAPAYGSVSLSPPCSGFRTRPYRWPARRC